MPSKHINDQIWRAVEKETVKAVVETATSVKDTDMLNALVAIGLKRITNDDYKKIKELARK